MADTVMGRPCKRGHEGLRYAHNRECVACKREQDRRRHHVAKGKRRLRRAPITVSELARAFAVLPRVSGMAEYHAERRDGNEGQY